MAEFTVCLTHDVDRVYKTHQYITRDLRQREFSRFRTLLTGGSPFWRFEQLMELEDRYSARSTFFFLKETIPFELFRPRRWKLSLGRYSYEDPRVAGIIRTLDAAGWDIGVHGSYCSYRDGALLRDEKVSLEQILGREVVGIRQHYLNLDVPETWRLQKAAGFQYDASLGKRNDIGFPGQRFHPFVEPTTGMIILPLALMEGYLFKIADYDMERAWQLARKLVDEAEHNKAVLTVLWHPHLYNDAEYPGHATIYERLIRECFDRGARFRTCHQLFCEYSPILAAPPNDS